MDCNEIFTVSSKSFSCAPSTLVGIVPLKGEIFQWMIRPRVTLQHTEYIVCWQLDHLVAGTGSKLSSMDARRAVKL